MLKTLKIKLITWLAKELLPVVDDKKILFVDKFKKIYIGGRLLTAQEIKNIKTDAELLESNELWKLITNNINEDVRKKVWVKSQDNIDLIVGKTMMYLLDYQIRTVKTVKNLN